MRFYGFCAKRLQRTVGNSIAPECGEKLFPACGIVLKVNGELPHQAALRFVEDRFKGRVVKPELFEVGKYGERDRRVPGVSFGLEDSFLIGIKIDRRFFGFDDETRKAVYAKEIIRFAGAQAIIFDEVHGRFYNHLDILRRKLRFIRHVPAKQLPEGIDVMKPNARFLVVGSLELSNVLGKTLHESFYGHGNLRKGSGRDNGWQFIRAATPI